MARQDHLRVSHHSEESVRWPHHPTSWSSFPCGATRRRPSRTACRACSPGPRATRSSATRRVTARGVRVFFLPPPAVLFPMGRVCSPPPHPSTPTRLVRGAARFRWADVVFVLFFFVLFFSFHARPPGERRRAIRWAADVTRTQPIKTARAARPYVCEIVRIQANSDMSGAWSREYRTRVKKEVHFRRAIQSKWARRARNEG